jgi:predicted ferric reductase
MSASRSFALALMAAIAVGALGGMALVPAWSALLVDAMAGAQPKAWWLLSRASGLGAYLTLSLSMLLGLAITNRWARLWPGGPLAVDVHRHASLLALGLAAVHALVLLGDRWVGFTLAGIALPFAAPSEDWLAIGIGQLAIYLLAIVIGSFYVRRAIGPRAWRALHFATFALFALVTVHGLASSGDGLIALYWLTSATVLFAAFVRLVRAIGGAAATAGAR